MMRSCIFFVLFIISIVTQIFGATVNNNGFYCNSNPRIYYICRKCPDLNQKCETSPRCQCDNIQIYNQGEKSILYRAIHILKYLSYSINCYF